MPKLINLIGQKFGRLTVIEQAKRNKHRDIKWLCLCDCGNEKIIIGYSLTSNCTKSCGCLRKEKSAERAKNRVIHGHKKDRQTTNTYSVWCSMIQRCTNPNRKDYYNYGGRGIKVCQRWKNSFQDFLKDMGERPKGHQIDRINNNSNYCNSNCV